MAKNKGVRVVKVIEPKIKEIKKEAVQVPKNLEQTVGTPTDIELEDAAATSSLSQQEITPILITQQPQSTPTPPATTPRREQTPEATPQVHYGIRADPMVSQARSAYDLRAAEARINPSLSTAQTMPTPQSPQAPPEIFRNQELARLRGEEERAYHEPLNAPAEKPKRRYPWEA